MIRVKDELAQVKKEYAAELNRIQAEIDLISERITKWVHDG